MDWQVIEIKGNKEILLKCHHITAEGSLRSYAYFIINGEIVGTPISRKFYYVLKELGVPTAQSLRGKK